MAHHWKAAFNASGLAIGTKCRACADTSKDAQRNKRAGQRMEQDSEDDSSDKENTAKKSQGSGGADADVSDFLELSSLTPNALSEALASSGDEIHAFSAIIDATEMETQDSKERCDVLAGLVWDNTDYRFSSPCFARSPASLLAIHP
ncbi:hypothetical protein C8F01DRAFT_1248107 [Mycena amicta]|nr:hypothetical protein C8F01DRAFT_1248107 [Mycena amicta]